MLSGHAAGPRWAFTLVELLVVLAVIAILAGILMPVLFAARGSGLQAGCVSNLRQLVQAARMYADDWDRRLPPARLRGPQDTNLGRTWCVLLLPYLSEERRVLVCPADPAPAQVRNSTDLPHSYGINYDLTLVTGWGGNLSWSLSAVPRTSDLVLFFDLDQTTPAMGSSFSAHRISRIAGRHRGGAGIGYLDGHVKVQPPDQLNQLRLWSPLVP